MTLKNIIDYPFKDWLKPVRFSIVVFPLFLLSIFIEVPFIQVIGFTLFSIAVIWLVASMLFLLAKKQWSKSFNTLLILIAMAIAIGLLS